MLYTVGSHIDLTQKKETAPVIQKPTKTERLFEVGSRIVFVKIPSIQMTPA